MSIHRVISKIDELLSEIDDNLPTGCMSYSEDKADKWVNAIADAIRVDHYSENTRSGVRGRVEVAARILMKAAGIEEKKNTDTD